MSSKDGGPAFARPISRYSPDGSPCDIYDAQDGMSLRDYFAAKALAALVAAENPPQAAKQAYQYADAMLAARDERKEPKTDPTTP